jgi:hypothetical protein
VNRYPSQRGLGIAVNDEQRVVGSGLVEHGTHGFVRLDDNDHRIEPETRRAREACAQRILSRSL